MFKEASLPLFRNKTFFSIEELNKAIKELLEVYNSLANAHT
jgi:hypothetical protein